MRMQTCRRRAIYAGILLLPLLPAASVTADVVTLKGGGVVRGKVVASAPAGASKTVAVRTQTGALIVFNQQSIQHVTRGTTPAPPAAKGKAKKSPLTPQETAWFPKIRRLLDRLFDGDADQRRRAHVDLLKIDDPDAIPALSNYLGIHPNERMRELFVEILRNVGGPNPVYYLVAVSLIDPSSQIREKAGTPSALLGRMRLASCTSKC